MEKLIRILPLGLFCSFSVKLMVMGAQLSDSLVLLIVAALSAFLSNRHSAEFSSLNSKIEELKKIIETQTEESLAQKKELEDTKALLGGIKLGQQLKAGQNRI